MKETELSKAIRDALDVLGVWHIRIQSGAIRVGQRFIKMGEPGVPDICLPALGWLEVKTKTGKVSDAQKAWHLRAAKENVKVAVVRSVKEAIDAVMSWRENVKR